MFRWAIISNSTVSPLVQRLKKQLETQDQHCEFFVSEHGDTGRQVFSPASEFYAFKPDIVVLYLDVQQIKPMLELSLPFETPDGRERLIGEVVEHVESMVKAIREHTSAVLLVHSFTVVPRTVLGIGSDQLTRNALRRLNLLVFEEVARVTQCYLLDSESLWCEAGFQEFDSRFDLIAQFPFGVKMQQVIIAEWMRYFRAQQGMTRKCVVVDLDNTLWGGILGEDGLDGIQMGDTPEGRPYRRFQQALQALSRRGVLLAISSKNNLAEVEAVFRQHPDLVLRQTDFAAMQINWDDKGTNLAKISRDLNIGLQHMVFLDDSAAERAWVRDRHPEVLVPEFPKDKSRSADLLCDCELDTLVITEEDLGRAQMYSEERERRAFQTEAPSFEDFLHRLQLEIEIEPLSARTLERAVQLCQRTNQFNLTTRRYNAEQLMSFAGSPQSKVLMMKARDRFGDYGWCGIAIATIETGFAVVDSFLLSCRVLGKKAECALFGAMVQWAVQQGCTDLRGRYIPSSKNLPCKDFFIQCGLKPQAAADAEAVQVFEAKLSILNIGQTDHIKVSAHL